MDWHATELICAAVAAVTNVHCGTLMTHCDIQTHCDILVDGLLHATLASNPDSRKWHKTYRQRQCHNPRYIPDVQCLFSKNLSMPSQLFISCTVQHFFLNPSSFNTALCFGTKMNIFLQMDKLVQQFPMYSFHTTNQIFIKKLC